MLKIFQFKNGERHKVDLLTSEDMIDHIKQYYKLVSQ
jgi:hypothetical protein